MTNFGRMVRIGALATVLGVAGVACGGDDDGSSGGSDVTGTTWQLVELQGIETPAEVTVTLAFDGEQVNGSGGCNNYFADASFDDGEVEISEQIGATAMACEQVASGIEFAYLAMLPAATSYAVDGDTLTLSGAAGETLARFTSS